MSQDENKRPDHTRQADDSERYLAFLLGKEQYAIPLMFVKEVIELSETTPIPQAPAYFKGIINLRGQVISVLDLRLKLQLAKLEYGPKTAIVILNLEPQICLGVIVDRINSVLVFKNEEVCPSSDFLGPTKEQYLIGVAQKENRMTLILNIRAALNLQDMNTISASQKAS